MQTRDVSGQKMPKNANVICESSLTQALETVGRREFFGIIESHDDNGLFTSFFGHNDSHVFLYFNICLYFNLFLYFNIFPTQDQNHPKFQGAFCWFWSKLSYFIF